jgi:hypothetical protein
MKCLSGWSSTLLWIIYLTLLAVLLPHTAVYHRSNGICLMVFVMLSAAIHVIVPPYQF